MTVKLAIWLLAGVAIAAAVGFIYSRGRSDSTAAITQQDTEAGNASDNARSRFDDCSARGMRFDSYAGQCVGASARRGN